MKLLFKYSLNLFLLALLYGCTNSQISTINTVKGSETAVVGQLWLSHEHILVDFIGADSIDPKSWNHDSVLKTMRPYLDSAKAYGVKYFVDPTPAYLGRDVRLLKKIADSTGLTILTNTGFYGAVKNKYIPSFAFDLSAEELAKIWIGEFENGIDGTGVRPGFIKISVDAADTLHPMHQKLVRAAAITHLQTGLLILSHTGAAKGLWPQLKILKEEGVSPSAFVWVHAQMESDNNNYLKAAQSGCWIAFDGMGWELEKHVEKLVFAKQHGLLDQILISHDAGWYDPQKTVQEIRPYTNIFTQVIPELKGKGFTEEEINKLLSKNPASAFGIRVRKL